MLLYDFLMDRVFGGFLHRCPETLDRMANFDDELQVLADQLVFTLPALHRFACVAYEQQTGTALAEVDSSYHAFRKALYAHPTNTLLRDLGGQVEVESAHKDHSRSRYKLIRLDRNSGAPQTG